MLGGLRAGAEAATISSHIHTSDLPVAVNLTVLSAVCFDIHASDLPVAVNLTVLSAVCFDCCVGFELRAKAATILKFEVQATLVPSTAMSPTTT